MTLMAEPAWRGQVHGPVTGGTANLEAFTDTRWATIRGDIAPYPF